MPLQQAIDLSPTYLCMEENQFGTIQSGEVSPVSFIGATDTDLCVVPVPQVDRDGATDLPKVSVAPTKSFTVCLSDSFPTQDSLSPEINHYQAVKQSTEKIILTP